MSDLIEQLWPAFQAEGSEQLDALELALVHNAGAGDIDLNAVFRYFHTIKGGCAMMGFGNMESIAHACEDLLDPVRKGSQALTDTLVDALLAAIDCLKLQMASAERTRQDPEGQPELLARLRGLLAPSPLAAATLAPAVAPDKNPDLAALAAIARDVLPVVAEELLRTKAWRKSTREQLLHLAREARVAAPAIMRLCDRLAHAGPEPTRQALFADLIDRLAWLERSKELVAGTEAAAVVLRRAGEGGFRAAVTLAGSRIEGAFDPVSGAPVPAQLPATLDSLDALLLQARLLRLVYSTRLLRLTLQLVRDVHRELLPPNPSLVKLLQVAIGLPAEILDGLEEDEPYAAMCTQLDEKLQQMTVREVQGAGLTQRCDELRQALEISPETLAALHAEGLGHLEAAVARQETIVELSTDPESASDAGHHFLEWMSASGMLIGSYTLAAGKGLCFVLASSMPLAELQRGLAQLQPGPAPLQLRHCAYRAHPGAASAMSAGPAVASADPSGVEAEAARAGTNGGGTGGTLRVDSGAVDGFVNRIGEMVMLRNMMAHTLQNEALVLRHSRVSALVRDCGAERTFSAAELQEFRALLNDIEAQREDLAQTDSRLQGTLGRLQEDVLALRVVPIALVFNRLPRLVRDLAHGLDRQVHLEISGEEVRIDKGMVDVLSEPMLHLVRNALDHGIEPAADRIAAGKPAQARLRVTARQQGNTLLVEVGDDGRGLDHERIRARAIANGLLTAEAAAALTARELHNLIFLPGFSTATQVTEVSGRGVGMDAVKTRVLKLGGQVEISTEAGRGTVFTLRLPLSAAIQNVILVDAGGRQLAIPERNVTEILSLPGSALQSVQGQACCLLRGVTLPLYHLARLLGQDDVAASAGAALEVVVLSDGVYRIGLIVERVLGRPEVFIRDIHPDLVRLPGVGGASILGDGRVVIIVDCENLFELAVRQAQSLHTLLRAS